MYSLTQRRRSHTFTEGTFEEVAKLHHGNKNLLLPQNVTTTTETGAKSKNDLIRQRSSGSPDLRKTDDRSPILQKLHRKFFSQGFHISVVFKKYARSKWKGKERVVPKLLTCPYNIKHTFYR